MIVRLEPITASVVAAITSVDKQLFELAAHAPVAINVATAQYVWA